MASDRRDKLIKDKKLYFSKQIFNINGKNAEFIDKTWEHVTAPDVNTSLK